MENLTGKPYCWVSYFVGYIFDSLYQNIVNIRLKHSMMESSNLIFSASFASDFRWCCLAGHGSPSVTQHVVSVESSSLLLYSIKIDLFVYRDVSLTNVL